MSSQASVARRGTRTSISAWHSRIKTTQPPPSRAPEFAPELSLVADLSGRVVGHVMISYAAIREGELLSRVAVPGHLAVAPEFQGRGIGSALVRRVVALADDRGGPVVVLQGSPGFYGRLGFEAEEAAQVLRLSNCISRSAERPTRVRDSDRGLTHHL